MNGFINLHHPLLQALGLTILHSLWQGVIIYFLLKMILSLVPAKSSTPRYGLAYGALSILFILFLFTLFSEWRASVITDPVAVQAKVVPNYESRFSWEQIISFRFAPLFKNYLPLVAVLYAMGVLALCSKMIWEIVQVKYLRQQVMLPDSLLQERFMSLKDVAGIKRTVLLRVSRKVQVPVMTGFLKPMILLPLSIVNRIDILQLETILLHELAHIKRNDYLWNLLQMVMETLLFFNPVAWYLSKSIRNEREHRCDDYVIRYTSSPLPYAHALLALEENRIALTTPVIAATGNGQNSLLNRIKRITTMNTAKRNSQKMLASVSILVLLAAMACFATAFGQEGKKEDTPKTIVKSYSRKVTKVTDGQGNTKTTEQVTGDTSGMAEAMKAVPMAVHMAGNAMKEIDWDELGKTIEGSMAQASKSMEAIDWKDIQDQVNEAVRSAHESVKDVDWKELDTEMEKAKLEIAQAMKEASVELKDIDWTEMRSAMDDAKAEMKKAKIEMKKTKTEMKKTIKEQGNQDEED